MFNPSKQSGKENVPNSWQTPDLRMKISLVFHIILKIIFVKKDKTLELRNFRRILEVRDNIRWLIRHVLFVNDPKLMKPQFTSL